VLLCLLSTAGYSQTYPVQVNVHALSPYGNTLSDYYATSREKLAVTLLNRDIQRPRLEVELQMTVSCSNGLKIQNRQGVYYPVITLDEGVVTRLTQDDLAPYFQNITQQGYMNGGKLPDGMVEFTFRAVEKYSRKAVSLPATARVWLSSQKPPLLNLPSAGEHIAFREPLNIRFQWMPQHKNISQVEYEFELRELPGNGAAPQSAFLYSPVIYSERMRFTTLAYTAMHPLLDPGKTYGWRVRAIAKDGADELNMFENSGYSEIRFFTLRTDCRPPTGCTATVKDRTAELTWTAGAGNTEYVVQWRSASSVSPEWKELTASDTKATLNSLERNTAYEYRVGGVCEAGGQPVFADVGKLEIGSRDLSNCGVTPVIDLSNREPLQELKAGDVVTVGGDFPMTITKVTGGSAGTFAGEGWTPVNWVFESRWAVEFTDLQINTDYRQIGGTVRAKQNKNNGQVADLDAFSDGGAVQNTRNGIVMPDLELEFEIPENPVFEYSEETGELTVYTTDGQEVGAVPMPQNEGKTVFPVVVKDKEGNLYKIEEEIDGEATEEDQETAPTTTGEGTKLTATYLGRQTAPLPKLDNINIAANTAVVTFEKGNGKFSFDEWKEYYGTVSIIAEKKVYDHFACGDTRYDVPWKLLPEGESDAVQAKIEIRDKNFDPEKVIFSTPQGTNYDYAWDSKNKTYTLNITAGADGDVQEIYALHRLSSQNYKTLGKLNVITYRKQMPKVVLVSVNGYKADAGTVKRELDKIYNPAGVTWEVAVDTFNRIADRDYFEKGSGLLAAYNDKMTALQNAYREAKGSLERNACYVFVLNHSGENGNRNTAGFMPRGKQFAYIFLSNIDKNEIGNVIAHELGHGLWKMRHTFDAAYGKTAEATEGTTDNLMDYDNGTHLAKWQWDMMSEPAIFDGVLDKDEEGMMMTRINILENVLLRRCHLHEMELNISKKSGKLDSKTNIFNYTTKDALFLIYEKEGTLSNITFTKDIQSANAYPSGNMYQIKINNFGVIKCLSEEDRDVLYDFFTNKKNNKILSDNKEVSLSGATHTFESLYNGVETLRADMDKSRQTVTETDKLIINIPLIQWQLGWNYASIFYYNWLTNGGDITADDNLTNWLQSWNVYKTRIGEFETEFNNHINKPLIERPKTKEYSAINSVLDLAIDNPQTNVYILKDLQNFVADKKPNYILRWDENDRENSNFAITTIAANEDAKSFSPWLASFGSVSIQHCFSGVVKSNNSKETVIDVSEMYIYISDGFDFNRQGNQPLGKWENNIFSSKTPTISAPTYLFNEDNELYLTNEKLNNFRNKYNIGNDFRLFLKPILIGNLFNQIIINKETNEITYQK
jgi:hypothetical protein